MDGSCAACDCEIVGEPINVTIGGEIVEVCCQECADALQEAHRTARGRAAGA